MFHHRSSTFGPSVSVIQQHLGAVEKELEKVGRMAGRRSSAAAVAAVDQLGEAVSTILNEMLDRFHRGRRMAGDEAARFGNEAVKAGAKFGNDALQRVATEIEERPLITIGIALGIGILIGAAVLSSVGQRD
jgi:ElaB/YqjD/DUF883 family membrane-anchored ribosome-binding protein